MNIFCDECRKNIATVFLTKISGSEVCKAQLCEECARKLEETTEAANLLAFLPQLLSSLQGPEGGELLDEVLSGELVICESCGTSFNDFRKMGFLGCAHCYVAFGDPLERLIGEFQGASEHVGKMPGKISDGAKLRKRLMELERHLERQIAEEQYEAAATARDQINEIKGLMKTGGKDGERE